MNGKFGIKLFAVVAIVLCMVSCSKLKGAGDATIRIAIMASPMTLDPRIATDAEGAKIADLICDGLFRTDENLSVVLNLADRYEKISDVSYRFFIKPGVKFHDGTPLTADDIVYTYKSIMDGTIESAYKSSFGRISEVVAESPEILRIDFKEPYAAFPTMLARGIVSKAAVLKAGDAFGRAPVCTGPYKILRFEPDSLVELEANPEYFGGAPKNKKLEFQVIKDDNVRVLKLIKGDVDIVQNAISPMLLETVLKNPNLAKQEGTGIVMTYMGFNLTDPILAKPKVREAIAYAVDRDEVISHRWKGLAVKANSILAPGNWAYDEGLKQYPYDPEKAKKLLNEAGLKDPDGDGPAKRFQLLYKTSTSKDRIDIARMIAYQLEKVGIGVRVEPYEFGKFMSDVRKGNFQVFSLSWVGATEPDIFFDVCHSSQMPPVGLNRDRYRNARVDKLVEEGRTTMDQEKRKVIYAEVQKILIDELPYFPLWYEKNVVVYNKDLSGVSLRPDAKYRAFMNVERK